MVERYRGGKSSETNNEYQEKGTKSEEMLLNWMGGWMDGYPLNEDERVTRAK